MHHEPGASVVEPGAEGSVVGDQAWVDDRVRLSSYLGPKSAEEVLEHLGIECSIVDGEEGLAPSRRRDQNAVLEALRCSGSATAGRRRPSRGFEILTDSA